MPRSNILPIISVVQPEEFMEQIRSGIEEYKRNKGYECSPKLELSKPGLGIKILIIPNALIQLTTELSLEDYFIAAKERGVQFIKKIQKWCQCGPTLVFNEIDPRYQGYPDRNNLNAYFLVIKPEEVIKFQENFLKLEMVYTHLEKMQQNPTPGSIFQKLDEFFNLELTCEQMEININSKYSEFSYTKMLQTFPPTLSISDSSETASMSIQQKTTEKKIKYDPDNNNQFASEDESNYESKSLAPGASS